MIDSPSFSFASSSGIRVGDLLVANRSAPGAVMREIEVTCGLLLAVLMTVTYFVVLLRRTPSRLLVALIMGGILSLVQQQILPILRRDSFIGTELSRELSSRSTETIQGLRLLDTGGHLDKPDRDGRNRSIAIEVNSRASSRVGAITEPITTFLPILMFANIVALSLLQFSNRHSGVLPSLVTVVRVLQRLNGTFGTISLCPRQPQGQCGPPRSAQQLLDPSDKPFGSHGGLPFHARERSTPRRDDTLQHTPDMPPALSRITVEIPCWTTVAPGVTSGAGRSSIADLPCGLYDPSEGEILIDGQPLQRLDLMFWQQRLGVDSQAALLSNTSIDDTIGFGSPLASRDQISTAATKTRASGFMQDLPQGFETLIGERGYRLSGGQRQPLIVS